MRLELRKARTQTLLVTQALSCSIGGFFFFLVNEMIGFELNCLTITMATVNPPTRGGLEKAELGHPSQGGLRKLTPGGRRQDLETGGAGI